MATVETFLIRAASDDDLARIVWLEERGFPDPWPVDLLAYELRHLSSFLYVAVREPGEPAAGYVAFRWGGGEAELLRLAVDPAVRRSGAGRRLVEAGLARLRRQGIASCHLEVRVGNLPAIGLYTALGFELSGRRRAYYRDGADALVYSLRLLDVR